MYNTPILLIIYNRDKEFLNQIEKFFTLLMKK